MNTPATILFIDDDPKAGKLWLRFLVGSPYQCQVYRDPRRALARFDSDGAELVITDLRMPGMSGIELLKEIRQRNIETPVIITTAYANMDSAIEALRLGATDFIKKPYDLEELLVLVDKTLEHTQLKRENRMLRRQLKDERLRYGMVGTSRVMQQVYRTIDKLAEVQCNVIIQGDSGTGKELAARAVHNRGPHSDDPFVVIDCGGITDTLLESELFGHRRGAFTGADRDRKGLLESAGTGTVFLDEIGNISDAMQMKLLRVLQEGKITPVGSTSNVPIHARFITATHRNLQTLVADGRFRHDLYHRLNVVTLTMPSLHERRNDIPALIGHFAMEFAHKYQRPLRNFSATMMRHLCERPWDGNIRELRNYVERCFIMTEGDCLDLENECLEPLATNGKPPLAANESSDQDAHYDLPPTLDKLEIKHIQRILESVGGNQTQAAKILGINRSTLWRKLRQVRDKAD
ncbi:MAG: sigma-54 dependent transcriptional regulator [Pseudomonadota bacterium]